MTPDRTSDGPERTGRILSGSESRTLVLPRSGGDGSVNRSEPAVPIGLVAAGDGEELFLNLRVMGPATPLPTWILSTERIGVTSTAVPTKKTSSAMYNISRGMTASLKGMSRSCAILVIASRVMPGRILVASGGV